jgi:hypothetical protein
MSITLVVPQGDMLRARLRMHAERITANRKMIAKNRRHIKRWGWLIDQTELKNATVALVSATDELETVDREIRQLLLPAPSSGEENRGI